MKNQFNEQGEGIFKGISLEENLNEEGFIAENVGTAPIELDFKKDLRPLDCDGSSNGTYHCAV